MKKFVLLFSVLAIFLSFQKANAQHPTVKIDSEKMLKGISEAAYDKDEMAVIRTDRGDVVIYLFNTKAPKTVYNWTELARQGYYDGLNFHRVIPNFMAQGGCPIGKGTGNPGYKFEDEFDQSLQHYGAGVLSMANSGPATNGSQFFITTVPTAHLNMKHSVFGQVVYGQDVVLSLGVGTIMKNVYVQGSKNIPDDLKHFFN